jgi:hypothetical protein
MGVTDGSYIQLDSLLAVLERTKAKGFVLFLVNIYVDTQFYFQDATDH